MHGLSKANFFAQLASMAELIERFEYLWWCFVFFWKLFGRSHRHWTSHICHILRSVQPKPRKLSPLVPECVWPQLNRTGLLPYAAGNAAAAASTGLRFPPSSCASALHTDTSSRCDSAFPLELCSACKHWSMIVFSAHMSIWFPVQQRKVPRCRDVGWGTRSVGQLRACSLMMHTRRYWSTFIL